MWICTQLKVSHVPNRSLFDYIFLQNYELTTVQVLSVYNLLLMGYDTIRVIVLSLS